MLFFKKKKQEELNNLTKKDVTEDTKDNNKDIEKADDSTKETFFNRLKKGLNKTGSGIGAVFIGKKSLDDELLEDLETALLQADVGIESTKEIIDYIIKENSRSTLNDRNAIIDKLEDSIQNILMSSDDNFDFKKAIKEEEKGPFVILVVGVNGVGKTTTIGKLANRFKKEGFSVMLAAGDTFRAAATEQLKEWSERVDIPIISQGEGSDSASVVFDAYHSAKAKGIDILIADTAGRLHTQKNLMDEIKKVSRVLKKANEKAPHETMLVLDACNGQNALNQAKVFNDSVNVTGITITKLDGTAKGGILLSISKKLGIPIRFIGVGEKTEDLDVFSAKDFSKALLNFKD